MKCLTISKPYVASSYRNKLHQWHRIPNFENHLIVPYHWGASNWEDSEEDSKYGLNIIKLRTVLNGKNHFFFFRDLEKTIRKIEPDFLNVEEEHYSLVTYQCLRIARKYQIPMSFYTWQNIYKNYPFPFSYFEKEVFSYCKFAFAGNEEAKDVLRKKSYHGDICVIPQMGIDTSSGNKVEILSKQPQMVDVLTNEFEKLKPGGFRFLYAGRMVEEKGLDILQKAFKELIRRQVDVRLILVGNGPLKAGLREDLLSLETNGLVLWMDFVPSAEMFKVYQSSDCLVLPSLTRKNWKEQFGRVLVEAMFFRVLCIGSNSGEIPNVIAEDKLIFNENDVHSLCVVMNYVHNLDLNEKKLFQEKAYKRALELYSNESIADKQYDFIKEHLLSNLI